jgi:hypothetical protein
MFMGQPELARSSLLGSIIAYSLLVCMARTMARSFASKWLLTRLIDYRERFSDFGL